MTYSVWVWVLILLLLVTYCCFPHDGHKHELVLTGLVFVGFYLFVCLFTFTVALYTDVISEFDDLHWNLAGTPGRLGLVLQRRTACAR